MTYISNESWLFDIDTKSHGFMDLPHSIVERICRYLPTQHDRYVACFINPLWSTSATSVLWETPEIRNPQAFKLFHRAIRTSKRSALSVRHLKLCLPDIHYNTLFRPIARSALSRHNLKDLFLADPNGIISIARLCERLKSLTVYGRQIETSHLEQLAAILVDLHSFCIIGHNTGSQEPFQMISFLPRLVSLTLDGAFPMTAAFINTLKSRCHKLTHLQFSMEAATKETFYFFSTGHGSIKELTLTGLGRFRLKQMECIVHSFPQLTRLCLDGVRRCSFSSIRVILQHCPSLAHLEIRALDEPTAAELFPLANDPQHLSLHTLLVENVTIENSRLHYLTTAAPHLQTLGISNGLITDSGLKRACQSLPYLSTLDIEHCPHITTVTLQALTVSTSLREIIIVRCGEMTPRDVYQICIVGVRHGLQKLVMEGYPQVVKAFSHYIPDSCTEETVVFGRMEMERLAEIDISQQTLLRTFPKERVLTSADVSQLALKLDITLNALETILDEVEEESRDPPAPELPTRTPSIQSRPSELKTKSASRIYGLKSPYRPGTPALWSKANTDTSITDAYVNRAKLSPLTPFSANDSFSTVYRLPQGYKEERELKKGKEAASLGGWGGNEDISWKAKTTPRHMPHPSTPGPSRNPTLKPAPIKHSALDRPATFDITADIAEGSQAHLHWHEKTNKDTLNKAVEDRPSAESLKSLIEEKTDTMVEKRSSTLSFSEQMPEVSIKDIPLYRKSRETNLSSDGSVDMDEDDGLILRTGSPLVLSKVHEEPKARMAEPPKHPGNNEWQSMQKWRQLRSQACVEIPQQENGLSRFGLTSDEGWSGNEVISQPEASSSVVSVDKGSTITATTTTLSSAWNGFSMGIAVPESTSVSHLSSLVPEFLPSHIQQPSQEQETAAFEAEAEVALETLPATEAEAASTYTSSEQLIDTSDSVLASPEVDLFADIASINPKPAQSHWRDISFYESFKDTPTFSPSLEDTLEPQSLVDTSDWEKNVESPVPPMSSTGPLFDIYNPVTPQPLMLTTNIAAPIAATATDPTPSDSNTTAMSTTPDYPVLSASNQEVLSPPPLEKPPQKEHPHTPTTLSVQLPEEVSPSKDYGKLLVKVEVETIKFGRQTLRLYENQEINEAVQKYCQEFEMQDHYDKLIVYATNIYTHKKTKRILNAKKKGSNGSI
ncbi:hypothetical protein BDF14DRAFT_1753342 [Spinellus fusiger]|nr:hypothetical protein BDF14DRAFT_1753342 [Spinellus fusiger]